MHKKCKYCNTQGGEDEHHKGYCVNCGAALEVEYVWLNDTKSKTMTVLDSDVADNDHASTFETYTYVSAGH